MLIQFYRHILLKLVAGHWKTTNRFSKMPRNMAHGVSRKLIKENLGICLREKRKGAMERQHRFSETVRRISRERDLKVWVPMVRLIETVNPASTTKSCWKSWKR